MKKTNFMVVINIFILSIGICFSQKVDRRIDPVDGLPTYSDKINLSKDISNLELNIRNFLVLEFDNSELHLKPILGKDFNSFIGSEKLVVNNDLVLQLFYSINYKDNNYSYKFKISKISYKNYTYNSSLILVPNNNEGLSIKEKETISSIIFPFMNSFIKRFNEKILEDSII